MKSFDVTPREHAVWPRLCFDGRGSVVVDRARPDFSPYFLRAILPVAPHNICLYVCDAEMWQTDQQRDASSDSLLHERRTQNSSLVWSPISLRSVFHFQLLIRYYPHISYMYSWRLCEISPTRFAAAGRTTSACSAFPRSPMARTKKPTLPLWQARRGARAGAEMTTKRKKSKQAQAKILMTMTLAPRTTTYSLP